MTVLIKNARIVFAAAVAIATAIGMSTSTRADTVKTPADASAAAHAAEIAHASEGARVAVAAPPAAPAPAAPAAAQTPSAPDEILTVVEVDGAKKNGDTGAIFDFGIVSPLDTDHFEHTFVLRNDNKDPVIVDKIPPTCGCTTVVVEGAKDQQFPMTIDPGKDIHVHTSIDAGHLSGGSFVKNVLVYLHGKSTPSHTLQLTGNMRAAISVDPMNLDFARVKRGQSAALPVTVLIDRRMLAKGWTPKVTSTVADVTVAPISEKDAKALAAKQPRSNGPGMPQVASTTTADDPHYASLYYKLTLSKKARIGYFWGQISIPHNDAAAALPGSTPGSKYAQQPNYGSVHGEVYGDISASPTNCSFGTVTQNTPVNSARITINGVSEEAVRDLKVESPNALIHCKLNPVDPKTPTARDLELTLDPKVAPGPFQSEVIVRTKKGDEIAISAMAYVMAPTPQPASPQLANHAEGPGR
jgi:hypothetical protein